MHLRGLGVRSAMMQSPSVILDSDTSTSLQNDIQAGAIHAFEDPYISDVIASWKSLSHADIPANPANCYQKVWDAGVSTVVYEDILFWCSSTVDQATAKALHAGDMLTLRLLSAGGTDINHL